MVSRADKSPHSTREGAQGADKREAILAAAVELFADKGFHGTAVPEIAEKARVGAGTIYRYFESKEAIVNALFQRHKSALLASVVDDFPYDAPTREQLHHFVSRVISFARKHPVAFKFLEAHHHAPYLDDKSRAMEANVLALANGFFEQHERARVVKRAPEGVLAWLLWGAVVGLVRAAWEGRTELTPKGEAAFEEALWDAIRRHPE